MSSFCCKLVALAFCLTVSTAAALQKDCRCFRFSGSTVSEGRVGEFKSPMFPRAYPLTVSCLLYVFAAGENEIVRLRFDRFELKPKIDGRCHDYVRLFLNSPTAELSAQDRPSYELCSGDLPQSEFYSSGRVLMLEFHSRLSPTYQTADSVKVFQGFKGTFRFEPAGAYKTDGALVGSSTCDYEFHSAGGASSGRFFSPGYPQNYPPGVVCAYRFLARPGERVRLDFHRISLGGRPNISRCLDGRFDDKDILLVTESERRDAPLLARFTTYCESRAKEQVVSPAAQLLLRFEANHDDVTGAGFAGQFGFVAMHRLQPTAPIGFGPVPAPGAGASVGLFNYTLRFDSRAERQGVIGSLHFPGAYPRRCRITYQFSGQPGEIVRISFDTFQLDEATADRCSLSYQGDKLLIYDGVADFASPATAVRCGSGPVDDIWSTGRSLTLVFQSDDRQGGLERGFRASFNFQRRPGPPRLPQPQLPQVEAARCSEPVIIGSGRGSEVTSESGGAFNDCPFTSSWLFVGTLNATERVVVEIQQLGGIGGIVFDASESADACPTEADRVAMTRYITDASDAVESVYCSRGGYDGAGGIQLPLRVMSAGKVPRLLVTYKAGSGAGGLRLGYSFVQDFGVSGRYKNQNWSEGCRFDYYSRQNRSGSFTSPNFPHAYPELLTCVYVFHAARQGEQIRVEFANFNTEASPMSSSCDLSDYVVAEDCDRGDHYSNLAASLTETRCGRPPPGSRFSFVRRASCLRLSFVSNARGSAPGFHANYYFDQLPGVIQLSQQDDQPNTASDTSAAAATAMKPAILTALTGLLSLTGSCLLPTLTIQLLQL